MKSKTNDAKSITERIFKLKRNKTNVKTEIMAGITIFLSMAYILAVNPSMLADAGMSPPAVFTATAISAVIGTLCMAFFANYPVALASGMGLNAYFAYSVCVPLAEAGINAPWKIALTAVFVEGIIFILLSAVKFRETLVNKVPVNLKLGITVGIGLFIAIVGLESAGVVAGDPSSLLTLGDMRSPQCVLTAAGIIITGVLYFKNVKGYVLWGMLATWLLGIIAQLAGWYVVDEAAGAASLIPDFSGYSLMPAAPEIFAFDFSYAASHVLDFAVIVFSFLFVDLFDTVGTLIGVADRGNMLDKNGNLPRVGGALMADAVGTVVGACLGTSTVTSYAESSTGVEQGGRTGLTAVSAACCFAAAVFLAPFFLAVPGFATAPALVFVGLLMMSSVKKMKFEGDIADVVGGFMAIIMMPFTYSIANGIMFGIMTWVILKIITGKIREIHPVMWVSFALFVLRLIIGV